MHTNIFLAIYTGLYIILNAERRPSELQRSRRLDVVNDNVRNDARDVHSSDFTAGESESNKNLRRRNIGFVT